MVTDSSVELSVTVNFRAPGVGSTIRSQAVEPSRASL